MNDIHLIIWWYSFNIMNDIHLILWMIFIEYYHDIVIRKILDNISNFYLPNIEDNPIKFFFF